MSTTTTRRPPTLVAGIDPGTSKFGFGVVDPYAQAVVIKKISLKDYLKPGVKLSWLNLGEVVARWLTIEDEVFTFVTLTCMEAMVVPKSNKLAIAITSVIHAALLAKYPHMLVVQLRPQTVRTYFGTSHPLYAVRKQKSCELAVNYMYELDPDALVRFRRTFTEKRKFDPDAVEASLYAIYAARELLPSYMSVRGSDPAMSVSSKQQHTSTVWPMATRYPSLINLIQGQYEWAFACKLKSGVISDAETGRPHLPRKFFLKRLRKMATNKKHKKRTDQIVSLDDSSEESSRDDLDGVDGTGGDNVISIDEGEGEDDDEEMEEE